MIFLKLLISKLKFDLNLVSIKNKAIFLLKILIIYLENFIKSSISF